MLENPHPLPHKEINLKKALKHCSKVRCKKK